MKRNFFARFSQDWRFITIWFIAYSSFYAIQIASNWHLLQITRGPAPTFWDLEWVIRWADCYRKVGISIYEYQQGQFCSGYMYGVLLLKLINALNISANQAPLIGIVTMLLLCCIFACLSNYAHHHGISPLIIFLSFASPGVWLLVASGNFDSWMIVLIFLAINVESFLARFALASAGTLLKFYSLPMMFFIILLEKRKRRQVMQLFITMIIGIYVIWQLGLMRGNPLFPTEYFFTFGSQSFGVGINLLIGKLVGNYTFLSGFGVFLVSCLYFFLICLIFNRIKYIRRYISIQAKENVHGEMNFAFFAFGGIYFGLFFQGLNYDYKLVFLIMFTLCTLSIYGSNLLINALLMCSLWFSCFSFGLKSIFVPKVAVSSVFVWLQLIGDQSTILLSAILFLLFIKAFVMKFQPLSSFRQLSKS